MRLQKSPVDTRPGGPIARRQPSPEGLGINPQEDLSAVGAALNLGLLSSKARGVYLLRISRAIISR